MNFASARSLAVSEWALAGIVCQRAVAVCSVCWICSFVLYNLSWLACWLGDLDVKSKVSLKIITKFQSQVRVTRLSKMVLLTSLRKKMVSFLWPHVTLTYFLFASGDRLASKMAAVAVVETSPGQDAIAEGLLDLLKPAIQQLDLHVHSVR